MNLKRYNGEFYIMEYEETEEKNLKLFVDVLNKNYQEIINFFNLKKLEKKIIIKLWNNVNNFRNYNKNKLNFDEQEWIVARTHYNDMEIDILTLEERRKCKGHNNDNIDTLLKCLIHEFVHICHLNYSANTLKWYGETLAVILSKQYNNCELHIDCTLDELLNKNINYINYYTIGKYLFDTYDRKYILELLRDKKLLEEQTPIIYEKAKLYIRNNKLNKQNVMKY